VLLKINSPSTIHIELLDSISEHIYIVFLKIAILLPKIATVFLEIHIVTFKSRFLNAYKSNFSISCICPSRVYFLSLLTVSLGCCQTFVIRQAQATAKHLTYDKFNWLIELKRPKGQTLSVVILLWFSFSFKPQSLLVQ
jgi:hypothetical protein